MAAQTASLEANASGLLLFVATTWTRTTEVAKPVDCKETETKSCPAALSECNELSDRQDESDNSNLTPNRLKKQLKNILRSVSKCGDKNNGAEYKRNDEFFVLKSEHGKRYHNKFIRKWCER